MNHPLVHITNSTPYAVSGKVSYASIFCSDNHYSAAANGGTWTATGNGICLVTQISATVHIDGKPIPAEAYTSSGTSFSQFAIICVGAGFAVTCVTVVDDDIDADVLLPAAIGQR